MEDEIQNEIPGEIPSNIPQEPVEETLVNSVDETILKFNAYFKTLAERARRLEERMDKMEDDVKLWISSE